METTATLIGKITISYDDFGNPVRREETTEILCEIRSVTRSEFYNAAQSGLTPSLVLRISHAVDYNDQKLVEVEGDLYSVIRAYRAPDTDAVELTLQPKIGNEGEGDG